MKKKMNAGEILTMVSDVGFGTCLGFIVDHFAKTGWICTATGFLVGIALAVVLKLFRDKKPEKKAEENPAEENPAEEAAEAVEAVAEDMEKAAEEVAKAVEEAAEEKTE